MFVVNLLAAAGHAITEWRHRQQAYTELMSLDDRSLADIGIRRSEIPAIVEGYHEASANPREHNEHAGIFAHRKLAGGHTWFPWFPPL